MTPPPAIPQAAGGLLGMGETMTRVVIIVIGVLAGGGIAAGVAGALLGGDDDSTAAVVTETASASASPSRSPSPSASPSPSPSASPTRTATPTPTATPTATPVPVSTDITAQGTLDVSSVFGGNQFPAALAVDGRRDTSWFSAGPAGDGRTTFTWTSPTAEFIESVAIAWNGQHATVAFRRGFGFTSMRVLLLDGDIVAKEVTVALSGGGGPDVTVPLGAKGTAVMFILLGSEAPNCGGFSELQVLALR